jgi:predicted metal-dependent hydrolase
MPKTPRGATVMQDGRAKAYRPIPMEARVTAVHDGLAAYRRGDFFLAHELLEPAWMGTDEIGERELIQGLIKLAAAYVHGVRGNPLGVQKNLRGARTRLVAAQGGQPAVPELAGLDIDRLLVAIDRRLAGTAASAPRLVSR